MSPHIDRLGRYRLVAPLARGGMAEVYRAVQEGPSRFEKPVAIKLLLEELTHDTDLVELFLFEARLAAQLAHPNICQVLDVGCEGGRYFIAMEFLHGQSLDRLLTRARALRKRLDPGLAVLITARVAGGLAHAHERAAPDGTPLSIVHRDISPQNVMVGHDGHVKVLDFGIAHAAGRVPRTLVGQVRGKVAYMSPEQVDGRPLDARSDLFSLGVVLHEALTGKSLFRGESDFRTMGNVLSAPIPPLLGLPGVPEGLAELVGQALERDVDRRFQSARELSTRLEELARDHFHASEAHLAAWMAQSFPDTALHPTAPPPVAPERTTGSVERTDADLAAPPTRSLRVVKPGTRALVRRGSRFIAKRTGLAVGLVVCLLGSSAILVPRLHRARGLAATLSLAAVPPPDPLPATQARPPQRVASAGPGRAATASNPGARAPPLTPPPGFPRPHRSAALRKLPIPAGALEKPPTRHLPAAPPAMGLLTLDTRPWANIYLDGRKLGTTPLVEVELPAGRQRLRALNPESGLDRTFDVEVLSNRSTTQRLVW